MQYDVNFLLPGFSQHGGETCMEGKNNKKNDDIKKNTRSTGNNTHSSDSCNNVTIFLFGNKGQKLRLYCKPSCRERWCLACNKQRKRVSIRLTTKIVIVVVVVIFLVTVIIMKGLIKNKTTLIIIRSKLLKKNNRSLIGCAMSRNYAPVGGGGISLGSTATCSIFECTLNAVGLYPLFTCRLYIA